MNIFDFKVLMLKIKAFDYRANEEVFQSIFPEKSDHLFAQYKRHGNLVKFWHALDHENEKHLHEYVCYKMKY